MTHLVILTFKNGCAATRACKTRRDLAQPLIAVSVHSFAIPACQSWHRYSTVIRKNDGLHHNMNTRESDTGNLQNSADLASVNCRTPLAHFGI